MTKNPMRFVLHRIIVLGAAFLVQIASARAVILFSTGDPTANTSAPSGPLAGSGWQYEGFFGGFLGTPIAPQFFLTAKHVSGASSVFTFQGTTYNVVNYFYDPVSDFAILQVTGTFPYFAPLYTKSDEVGRPLVAIGRGTQRGDSVVNGTLRGWLWGASDGVERWGENVVFDIAVLGPQNETLYATFDQNGLPNECHLSSGDSGGAVFLNDNGTWKLAGIHYSVDGYFYTDSNGSGQFDAALFDARDYYYSDYGNPPTYTKIAGPDPVPSGFYSTRVSSKLGWIYSVIDPVGDIDSDNVQNLCEYALFLDPVTPDATGIPHTAREGNNLTFIYTKVLSATDITYTVEKSTDLISWFPAQTQDQIIAESDGIQTIKSTVPIGINSRLFLRLNATRP